MNQFNSEKKNKKNLSHLCTGGASKWPVHRLELSNPFEALLHFRPINRFLNPIALTRILEMLAALAGLTPEEVFGISGHSLRGGAAQQLIINGVQLLPIMRASWSSMNIVARYVEDVNINVWGTWP